MTWLNDATVTTAADKAAQAVEQARQQAKADLDAALSAMTYAFEDGAEIQNRPSDAANIQTAIAMGTDRDWLMADNTKRLTTVAEMQAAFNAGVAEAAGIWQAYIDEVDAL